MLVALEMSQVNEITESVLTLDVRLDLYDSPRRIIAGSKLLVFSLTKLQGVGATSRDEKGFRTMRSIIQQSLVVRLSDFSGSCQMRTMVIEI